MTSELKERLEEMADRGEWRGADTIMTAARFSADHPATVPLSATTARSGWAVALGAAALVIVLVGGFVWLVGGTGTDMVAEPMVSSTPVPSTVTSVPVSSTTAPAVPVPTTEAETAPTTVGETSLGWVETELRPSDASADTLESGGDWYGYDVAVDGDRIVIGSPLKHEGMRWAGAVYVFEPD
ncbi:MAG: FG-GAP repeat protein, partial [Actinomycetota bacterium]